MAQQQGGAPHASEYAESIDITPANTTADPLDAAEETSPDTARPASAPESAPESGPAEAAEYVPADASGFAAADAGAGAGTATTGSVSTRRRVVLGSILALGLAGAAVFGVAGARILQQKDATLSAPERVAGLTRDDSAQAADMADYLRTALAAGLDLDATVGAVYNDPADADRGVLFYGGTALIFRPERELD
ncbi:MAG TPA: hypothetical protein VFR67_26845, partial [Pilimelia sp.]|nr:hypothetical protein [Pilimelia sp.]